MRTWLISLLTAIVIIPVPTTLASNFKNVIKQQTFIKTLNNYNNFKISNNSGYDWYTTQNAINNQLNNPKTKAKLNPEQINNLKLKSSSITNQFKTTNATNNQAINFLNRTNPQFKDIYNNNQNGFSQIKDKINAQYFSIQKVDLNLDGSNTYSDAINSLNIVINSTYPGNNIVVSLIDKTLANKYLFDDSTSLLLSNFINNNISIKVNVQFNNISQVKTINLTNIKINPANEDAWLYECIKYYFNADNKQDLQLEATNNGYDGLNNVIAKINERFNLNIGQDINKHNGIQIAIIDLNKAKDNFMQKENIIAVMNQNMHFNVIIADYNSIIPKISKASLYLSNINFNCDEMKDVINTLWLNNDSKINPIDLQITSDQTYQDVVNNFNQRMENLNQKDHFQVQLTDQSLKSRKLDDDYNPATGIFKANVQFSYLVDGTKKILNNNNINQTNLYLSHVTLSKWAQKIKDKFNSALALISDLNIACITLTAVSVTSAVLSVAFWLSCNGPWATSLTLFSAATGVAAAVISLKLIYLQNEVEQLAIDPLVVIADVLSITYSVFCFIYYFMITLDATIESDWMAAFLYFSAISIIAATVSKIHSWIS